MFLLPPQTALNCCGEFFISVLYFSTSGFLSCHGVSLCIQCNNTFLPKIFVIFFSLIGEYLSIKNCIYMIGKVCNLMIWCKYALWDNHNLTHTVVTIFVCSLFLHLVTCLLKLWNLFLLWFVTINVSAHFLKLVFIFSLLSQGVPLYLHDVLVSQLLNRGYAKPPWTAWFLSSVNGPVMGKSHIRSSGCFQASAFYIPLAPFTLSLGVRTASVSARKVWLMRPSRILL